MISNFCRRSLFPTEKQRIPLVSFDLEKCIPPSLMKDLNSQVIYVTISRKPKSRLSPDVLKARASIKISHGYSENDIAVVGVSCQVAGANDVEKF